MATKPLTKPLKVLSIFLIFFLAFAVTFIDGKTAVADSLPDSEKTMGYWETIPMPAVSDRLQSVHTILLPNGKVLMVNGSSFRSTLVEENGKYSFIEGVDPTNKDPNGKTEDSYGSYLVYGIIGILSEELKLNNKEEDYLDDLSKVAEKIKESPLPEKLKNEIIIVLRNANAKVVEPENRFETLQQEIETWYQNSTEYASRLSQKKAIILSRVVALLLVIMFNIDTINIVDHLSKSEVLSSTFSSTIMGVIQSSDRSDYCSENDETLDFKTCMEGIEDEVKTILDRVDNLPIGWNWSDPWKEQFTPLNSGNVINALTGWMISAIAISMGAPFWFDILKKLTRIKSENSSKDES